MDLERASRSMSYFLRHSPDHIDWNGGWAKISDIVAVLASQYPGFGMEQLMEIVATDRKGRYAISPCGKKIRANQGHSVPGVVIEMLDAEPPEILYHGTATRFLHSILKDGLRPMTRQFVHISPDVKTATAVGARHGKPVILAIRAKDFVADGHELKLSANGVWQARAVPPQYLSILCYGARESCGERKG